MVRQLVKRKTVKSWGGGRNVVGQIEHLLRSPRTQIPGWWDIVRSHPPDSVLQPEGLQSTARAVAFPEDRLRRTYERRNPDHRFEFLDPTLPEFKTRTTKFVLKQLEFIAEGKSERVAYALAHKAMENVHLHGPPAGLSSEEALRMVAQADKAARSVAHIDSEEARRRQELLSSIISPYVSEEGLSLKKDGTRSGSSSSTPSSPSSSSLSSSSSPSSPSLSSSGSTSSVKASAGSSATGTTVKKGRSSDV